MFRADEIKTGLLNWIGWRQAYDPDNLIGNELTVSESGEYYQDVHPLLTIHNIRSVAPAFENVVYPDWVIGTTYTTGERVTDTTDSKTYRAKRNNVGQEPNSSPDDWAYFDPFSEWLEDKTKASNLKLIRSFYSEKLADKTAKNVMYQKYLFDGAGRLNDVIENQDKIVGMELVPIRAVGVTLKIEKIGLQFEGTGDIEILIYHSSRELPVNQITCSRTINKGMQWFTPTDDIYLPYVSSDNDAGGSYYLVYRQSNLPVGNKAINKDYDFSKRPCNTCNTRNVSYYKLWSKYLEVHPFKVDDIGTGNLWDVADNLYTYNQNYGINLQLSAECDITEIILENKRSFQAALGLQMAHDMVQEFAYNPNAVVNRYSQQLSKNELLYELNGNKEDNENSISYQLRTAKEALNVDLSAMSRICFKCGNKGIRYRTV